jgi:hypothetical protein
MHPDPFELGQVLPAQQTASPLDQPQVIRSSSTAALLNNPKNQECRNLATPVRVVRCAAPYPFLSGTSESTEEATNIWKGCVFESAARCEGPKQAGGGLSSCRLPCRCAVSGQGQAE